MVGEEPEDVYFNQQNIEDSQMSDFNKFLSEQLKDSQVKAEYDALALEFKAIQKELEISVEAECVED